MTLSYEFYLSQENGDLDTNGRFPITDVAPSAGTLPVVFASMDAQDKTWIRKLGYVYTGTALAGRRLLFRQPPIESGDHYFTFVLEPAPQCRESQVEMLADLPNRRQYGQLKLTQATVAGVSDTLSVEAKNIAMFTGDSIIIHADGLGVTDNGHLDARLVGDSSDTASREEVTVESISNIIANVDNTASAILHLSAAVQNVYAIGTKFQTYPDNQDYVATATDLDDTNIVNGLFDISKVETNGEYTWEDTINVSVTNAAGDYTVSSERFGAYAGSGNKASDFILTNTSDTYFSEKSLTILANALTGTWVGGESFTFQTHLQGGGMWIIYNKPPLAGIIKDELTFSFSAEEDSTI